MLELLRSINTKSDLLTDEERRAIWRATWTNLPLAACTIVVFNVLPSLILWKAPQLRGWLSFVLWLIASALLAALANTSSGTVIVNGRARSYWAPWQAVAAAAIDLLVVGGVLWLLPHLPD
jgi:hypothetical protein